MTTNTTWLTERPAWQALTAHHEAIKDVHLRTLFAEDAQRGERLTADVVGLYFDYSKHRVTDETIRLLLALAEECRLQDQIADGTLLGGRAEGCPAEYEKLAKVWAEPLFPYLKGWELAPPPPAPPAPSEPASPPPPPPTP